MRSNALPVLAANEVHNRLVTSRVLTRDSILHEQGTPLRHINFSGLRTRKASATWTFKSDFVMTDETRSAMILMDVRTSKSLGLTDLGGILARCRVVKPTMGIILSTKGLSRELVRVLTAENSQPDKLLGRDVAEQGIVVGQVDEATGVIRLASILPTDKRHLFS